jgi:hypothetical protein
MLSSCESSSCDTSSCNLSSHSSSLRNKNCLNNRLVWFEQFHLLCRAVAFSKKVLTICNLSNRITSSCIIPRFTSRISDVWQVQFTISYLSDIRITNLGLQSHRLVAETPPHNQLIILSLVSSEKEKRNGLFKTILILDIFLKVLIR